MSHSVLPPSLETAAFARASPHGWRCALLQRRVPLRGRAEAARLDLRDVRVTLDEGVYELDANLDLPLPEDARKAVDSGLTLRLTYEIVIDRVRRYMPDAEVAALRATLRSGLPRA